MELVRVTTTIDGWPSTLLDPAAYLEALPGLSGQLPAGALRFASDPDHYDFASGRCVHDLRFAGFTMKEAGSSMLTATLLLRGNPSKHRESLTIGYQNVQSMDLRSEPPGEHTRVWPESPRLGDVQLDEVLPHPAGCSHEIALTGGTIVILASDLRARWEPVEPEPIA